MLSIPKYPEQYAQYFLAIFYLLCCASQHHVYPLLPSHLPHPSLLFILCLWRVIGPLTRPEYLCSSKVWSVVWTAIILSSVLSVECETKRLVSWCRCRAGAGRTTLGKPEPMSHQELFSLMVAMYRLLKQRACKNMRISWIRKRED